MATVEYSVKRGSLFSVLADGKFHTTVDEGAEGAVRRDYKTSDGKEGTKFELVAERIGGIITELSVYEGDFGKNVLITFGDELPGNNVTVSLSANSSFGEDFLKKLPNIDASKEVLLSPYSFTDDKGKLKKGISIVQNGGKIKDFYHEENTKTKKWDEVNGYPAIPAGSKKWSKDEWKIYFAQARVFLVGEFAKHPLFKNTEAKEDNTDIDFK